MSITIRCTGCGKKISMDEGFAGGACRCPYCREIVLVGGATAPAAGVRPQAPVDRPEGPDEPAAAGPAEAPVMAEVISHGEVPMARPVRLQGILTLVLLGLLLAMVAGAIVLALQFANNKETIAYNPDGSRIIKTTTGAAASSAPVVQDNPFSTPAPAAGAAVAGLRITAPVIYCIDCGGSMKETFDYARFMARVSIRSLKNADKFSIYLSCQGEDKILEGDYHQGGPAGELGVRDFLENRPSGQADIKRTLLAAIDKKPRTIVLLRRDGVADMTDLIAQAVAKNVSIVVVGLASGQTAAQSLEDLAKSTHGASAIFTEQDLDAFTQKAPPLE